MHRFRQALCMSRARFWEGRERVWTETRGWGQRVLVSRREVFVWEVGDADKLCTYSGASVRFKHLKCRRFNSIDRVLIHHHAWSSTIEPVRRDYLWHLAQTLFEHLLFTCSI